MIHSFLRTLNSLRKQWNPEQFIITWESHGTKSWRRELLPTYKPSSGTVSQDYISELQDLQLLLYLLNIKQYYSPNNEADDVIATLVKPSHYQTLIYTVDKDIMQLVSPVIQVWTGKELMTEATVHHKFGIAPHQIPDYLAILGDTSDNIKGIDKYGPKKTLGVLKKYPTIEDIPISEPLYQYLQQLYLNKKLTLLNHNCKLESIPNENFKTEKTLTSILDKYELVKIKENIDEYKLLR